MLENLDLGTVISVILTGLTVFAGGVWLKAKSKLSKVIKLGMEVMDVVTKFEAALSDNKVTKEEIEDLKEEAADVKAAFKDLVAKESE